MAFQSASDSSTALPRLPLICTGDVAGRRRASLDQLPILQACNLHQVAPHFEDLPRRSTTHSFGIVMMINLPLRVISQSQEIPASHF